MYLASKMARERKGTDEVFAAIADFDTELVSFIFGFYFVLFAYPKGVFRLQKPIFWVFGRFPAKNICFFSIGILNHLDLFEAKFLDFLLCRKTK